MSSSKGNCHGYFLLEWNTAVLIRLNCHGEDTENKSVTTYVLTIDVHTFVLTELDNHVDKNRKGP